MENGVLGMEPNSRLTASEGGLTLGGRGPVKMRPVCVTERALSSLCHSIREGPVSAVAAEKRGEADRHHRAARSQRCGVRAPSSISPYFLVLIGVGDQRRGNCSS